MKKFIALMVLYISFLISHPVLSMIEERVDVPSHVKTQSVHSIRYMDGTLEFRSPQTAAEWNSYHTIRIAEIQERYCQGKKYNYNNPEEEIENNFRFAFVDSSTIPSKVVGTIRVDLLEDEEAALRWVTIDGKLQKQGLGTRMLVLAETFIRDRGRTLIRVPAEEYSRAFYERLEYIPMDWPNGPHHAGEVSLGKWLIK